MPVTSGNTGRFLFTAYWMGGSGSTDGGGYGDPYHSNPTVNCADRAVVRLRQVGAVILYRLERPGSDAARAHKANGRLVLSFITRIALDAPPSLQPMTGASFLAANVWSFCAEVAQS